MSEGRGVPRSRRAPDRICPVRGRRRRPPAGAAGLSDLPSGLFESQLSGRELVHRGKVRDLWAVDDEHLLVVATDRLSAFDVVLPNPIPGKGAVLTELTLFWLERTRRQVRNHLAAVRVEDVITDPAERAQLAGRAMVVRRLRPLPLEVIVRGYLIGSGWKDYQETGKLCGITLPAGLRQADRLPRTLFTPSTKAAPGEHDANIDLDEAARLVGGEVLDQVSRAAIAVYEEAAAYARGRGIIIADTKFEFAIDADGVPVLIDEVLTPDSSRFWPEESYRPGISPPSFDKQYVRDYLESIGWSKRPPAPTLPEAVVTRTASKYREARDRLLGGG
ncbi:MAG: phosphoribosylaminoimidazolesuccinocarboxamide synthase [Chromatiales bacterium]|nr:phosphoribosylaminoimidazolesuccinocarboxamide synthase [Chromatiales bacterium]